MPSRSSPAAAPQSAPQYAWALDRAGRPVPISQAVRGVDYVCPLCGGRMIPRLGEHLQHHFGHDQALRCPPEAVARIAARRWLGLELQRLLAAGQGVLVRWPCPLCHETHSANLLHDVTRVQELYPDPETSLDLALLDEAGAVRWAIVLARPGTQALRALTRRGLPLLVVDVVRRGPDLASVSALLAGARIYGGLCATARDAAARQLITEPEALRAALIEAVAAPPYRLYGPLERDGALQHVFTLQHHKLWLPPLLWERAIGGLHHRIPPALQVISQEWPLPDGATVALYYITVRATSAIAVRRFPAGQAVYARIAPETLHSPQLTALDVARSFAEV